MYKLTKSLPFMLLTITSHVTGAFAAELAADELTISMYRVMAALVEREDQRLGELSEMIFIEVTALSRLVGAMSGRGLVSRHRQENDERSLRINITAQGRALLRRLIPRAQYFEGVAIRGIASDKLTMMSDLLSEMLGNVEALRDHSVIERHALAGVPAHRGKIPRGTSSARSGRAGKPVAPPSPGQALGTAIPLAQARRRQEAKPDTEAYLAGNDAARQRGSRSAARPRRPAKTSP